MEKVLELLDTVLVDWLGAGLLGAAALVSFWQVFTRNVLNFTSVWAEEFPRYAVVLAVCIALGEGWRNNRNLRMLLLTGRLRAGGRRVLRGVADLAGLAVSVFLCNAGLRLVAQQFQQQVTTGTSLNLPAWIPSLSIPVGAALLAIACLAGIIRNLTGRWDPMAPDEKGGH